MKRRLMSVLPAWSDAESSLSHGHGSSCLPACRRYRRVPM